MQRLWSADELGERWSLLPEDLALLAGRVDAGKLGFAVHGKRCSAALLLG
jgi:hypothetical protein